IAGATTSNGPLAQRALAFGPRGEVKPSSWVIAHCIENAQMQKEARF
ncbi:1,4-beta-xylanase, partial [Pseudomonas syringae pv. tagetis]